MFASTLGLYLIDSGGNISNLTQNIFSQSQWSALPVASAFAFYHKDSYLCFFKSTVVGIEFRMGSNEIRRFATDSYVWGGRYVSTVSNLLYQLQSQDEYDLQSQDGYDLYCLGGNTPISYDTLYIIFSSESGREIKAWGAGDYIDYRWESKEYRILRKDVLTAMRIEGDFSSGEVKVELLINDVVAISKTITQEGLYRILPQTGSTFRVRLIGKARVKRILFGPSLSSLISNEQG
jgi:hypothetical protein